MILQLLGKNKKAFTLVELMVSLFLAGIVAFFVYILMTSSYSSYSRLQSASRDSDNIKFLLTSLEESMRNAVYVTLRGNNQLIFLRVCPKPIEYMKSNVFSKFISESPFEYYKNDRSTFFIEERYFFYKNRDKIVSGIRGGAYIDSSNFEGGHFNSSGASTRGCLVRETFFPGSFETSGVSNFNGWGATTRTQMDLISNNIKNIDVRIIDTGVLYSVLELTIYYDELIGGKVDAKGNIVDDGTNTLNVNTRVLKCCFSSRNIRADSEYYNTHHSGYYDKTRRGFYKYHINC